MTTDSNQHYRWEFLRRNSRYRKDYASLIKTLGKSPEAFFREFHQIWLALYVHPASKVENLFPGADIKAIKQGFYELARFKEKWLLSRPLDPANALPHDMVLGEGSKRPTVEILSPTVDVDGDDRNGMEEIVLRINLAVSRKEIIAHLEDLLTVYQRLYAENHFAELREPKWVNMDLALRVYDAMINQEKSLEATAKIIYPEIDQASANDRQALLDRTKKLLEVAQELVELGPECWNQGTL